MKSSNKYLPGAVVGVTRNGKLRNMEDWIFRHSCLQICPSCTERAHLASYPLYVVAAIDLSLTTKCRLDEVYTDTTQN